MASESFDIFQNLIMQKSLKYISFEQASVFLTTKEEKLILQRAAEILSQSPWRDDDAPPRYTLVDTQRYSAQMFQRTRQDEAGNKIPCERRAQERIEAYESALSHGRRPKKPLPWFATEVPRELRRIKEDSPRELCTILQLTYLENTSQRITGLADGKDKLEYLSHLHTTENTKPLAVHRQSILEILERCKTTSKITNTAVRALFGKLVSQFKPEEKVSGSGPSSQSGPSAGFCAGCMEYRTSKTCTLPCTHSYCLPCVAKFVKTALDNERLWPAKCCQQEIPKVFLEQALSKSELRMVQKREKEFAVPLHDRFYCKRSKCRKLFVPVKTGGGDETTCPHCKFKMCFHCRGARHRLNASCVEDKNLQAFLAESVLEEWCICPQCRYRIELIGDCPRIECRCGYQFCWVCRNTSASCATTNHPNFIAYFRNLQEASARRRLVRETRLDRELTLRRVLHDLLPPTTSTNEPSSPTTTNPTDLIQTFISEYAHTAAAINLHTRFTTLYHQFLSIHTAQLQQITTRNTQSILLATTARDHALEISQTTPQSLSQSIADLKTSRHLNARVLALQHNSRLRELNHMLASEYLTPDQVATRIQRSGDDLRRYLRELADGFERDMAPLQVMWEGITEVGIEVWVAGKVRLLNEAERVLGVAQGRMDAELRWAEVTRRSCLAKIEVVEGWEWGDMFVGRLREWGLMGGDDGVVAGEDVTAAAS